MIGETPSARNAAADDLAERSIREQNRFQGKWAQLIGPDDCPLMRRWVLVTPLGSIRLHHFLRSDADRHPHDHPWWFVTLVLAGEYDDYAWSGDECAWCGDTGKREVFDRDRPGTYEIECDACDGGRVPDLVDRLRRGSIRFRPALHRHQVKTDGCWTLVATGRNRRRWGFWDNGIFRPVADYFRRYGYAACEDVE